MLMKRDQRNRFRRRWITKAGHNAGFGQSHGARWSFAFGFDQLAVFGPMRVGLLDAPFFTISFNWNNACAFWTAAKNANNARCRAAQFANDASFVLVFFSVSELNPCQKPVTDTQRRIIWAQHHKDFRFRRVTFPFNSARK